MGRLFEVLGDFLEEYKEVLRLASLVQAAAKKQEEMHKIVFDSVLALKPLSHKFRVVCSGKNKWGSRCEICVGAWIRERRWGKYGSVIKWPDELFDIIRRYGDEIAEVVRKPIKEVFEELVRCVKELRPYIPHHEEVAVDKPISYYVVSGSGNVKVRTMHVSSLELDLETPRTILIHERGRNYPCRFYIDSWENMIALEDLLPELKLLYEKALAYVRDVEEHNKPLLKKIKELVAPFAVVEALAKS